MAAQTWNNLELTRAIQMLQGQISDLETRLSANIPKVEQDLAQTRAAAEGMFAALRAEVQPEVDKIGTIITTVSGLQDQLTAERVRVDGAESTYAGLVNGKAEYESKINQLESKVNQLIADAGQISDTVQASTNQIGIESQSRVTLDSKIDFVSNKLEQLVHDHEHLKRVEETHYASQQMQIATVQGNQDKGSGSSGGGGMGSREPLATNKLVASEDKIEGVEDKQTLEDWFENVAMKVNLVYPGAKTILDWAASNAAEITASEINRRGDSTLATMLSLQMYVFLKCKTKATAANHLKTLSSERGLEGWRILRKELMGGRWTTTRRRV